MIIIEGADLLGKTTLAKRLVHLHHGYVYAHFTRLDKKFDYVNGYIARASRRVVQDRFHMSEVVYSMARGEDPMVSEEEYRYVDGYLRRLGAYTVVVTASPEYYETVLRCRMRSEEMYDEKIMARANEFFVRAGNSELCQMDVDLRIELSKDHPMIDDRDVAHITCEYRKRQSFINAIRENEKLWT